MRLHQQSATINLNKISRKFLDENSSKINENSLPQTLTQTTFLILKIKLSFI